MTTETILIILAIGALAGWMGSMLFSGNGLGLPGNIVVGILGSFVGSWLLGKLNINIGGSAILNAIITGAIGAFVILLVLNLLFGKK